MLRSWKADGDALLGEGWYLWVELLTAGEITVTLDDEEILRQAVDAGETEISWDGHGGRGSPARGPV